MVNMWLITHDPQTWESLKEFRPEKFVEGEGGRNMDVRGIDLRFVPLNQCRLSSLP